MLKVAELNKYEKEEVIFFLANALISGDPKFIKNISNKVMIIVLPFLTDVATEILKEQGGEKIEI